MYKEQHIVLTHPEDGHPLAVVFPRINVVYVCRTGKLLMLTHKVWRRF